MISNQNVKARKDHICEACLGKINKGDMYTLIKYKTPRFAENEYDPTEDGKQIGIDFWNVKVHLVETNCSLPEDCRNGKHSFTLTQFSVGFPYLDLQELCENCGFSREDAVKPPVTFTNWDKECDLLIEWLRYTILYEPLDNVSIQPDPLLSPQQILKMFQEQGWAIFDSTSYIAHKHLDFETWKQTLNQTQYV